MKVNLINHPLVNIKLTKLRDKKTNHIDFKKNLNEISSLMVYEILRDYKTKEISVETPNNVKTKGYEYNKEIIIVPIIRAGLGMVEGIENLVPFARVGHVGLFRDEKTLETNKYFFKMPEVIDKKNTQVIIVDPMVASGHSAVTAIKLVEELGFEDIIFVALLTCPEGIKYLEENSNLKNLFVACIDEKLNEKGFIIPGVGDAGDRIFGTK